MNRSSGSGSALPPENLGTREERQNLVLVHSFPTNSLLLAGLIEFLNDHFNLFFIDLPGFTRASPPLRKTSVAGYASFLEQQIQELDLSHYILGGISFGFLVANKARVDDRCRAILAMEPFLGVQSLYMGSTQRLILGLVAKLIVGLRLSGRIWASRRFRARMLKRGEPRERVDLMLREIDPRTYFSTARELLRYSEEITFRDQPYVLLVNPEDTTISAVDVTKMFQANLGLEHLLVVQTTIDHYPTNLTKQYFEERISHRELDRVVEFIAAYHQTRQHRPPEP